MFLYRACPTFDTLVVLMICFLLQLSIISIVNFIACVVFNCSIQSLRVIFWEEYFAEFYFCGWGYQNCAAFLIIIETNFAGWLLPSFNGIYLFNADTSDFLRGNYHNFHNCITLFLRYIIFIYFIIQNNKEIHHDEFPMKNENEYADNPQQSNNISTDNHHQSFLYT